MKPGKQQGHVGPRKEWILFPGWQKPSCMVSAFTWLQLRSTGTLDHPRHGGPTLLFCPFLGFFPKLLLQSQKDPDSWSHPQHPWRSWGGGF